jgi:hypothetical protein
MITPSVFKAGYLPGLQDHEVEWQRHTVGAPHSPMEVDLPVLSHEQMSALAQRVQAASTAHLKTMTVSDIVHVLEKVTSRLLDSQDPYRIELEHLLPKATGFDAEMVRLNLTSYLQTFRGLQLHRFVAQDFNNPKILDEFQPRIQGGWSKALGPDLMVHIWAGNVPALPMWSFIAALLVKSGSIGKISRAEPVFASLLARLLAEVEPQWAHCFSVVWWPSEHTKEQALLSQAEVVLAYGGNEALNDIKTSIPVTTRFLAHGHKLSFSMISKTALSVQKGHHVARQAALDVVRYEQQGCYSPQMIYVERGASLAPKDFAELLLHELINLEHKFSPRELSLHETTQIAKWRDSHELIALNSNSHSILGNASSKSTVIFSEKPLPLSAGPLNRNVLVVAVDDLKEVIAMISSQRNYLQTVGLAASPEELFKLGECLGQQGVTRICALGSMTSPEAGWHHDGRFSLLDLVRMVDIDASTEREAERFTSYEI